MFFFFQKMQHRQFQFDCCLMKYFLISLRDFQQILSWYRGVVVITTTELHLTRTELFCTGSNLTCSKLDVIDGGNLPQWPQMEIRYNPFRWSTTLLKQIIAIIILLLKFAINLRKSVSNFKNFLKNYDIRY